MVDFHVTHITPLLSSVISRVCGSFYLPHKIHLSFLKIMVGRSKGDAGRICEFNHMKFVLQGINIRKMR